MLVSPSSTPKDDVFERKDNYYVYLKPFDVADEVVCEADAFPRQTAGVDPDAAALRCSTVITDSRTTSMKEQGHV